MANTGRLYVATQLLARRMRADALDPSPDTHGSAPDPGRNARASCGGRERASRPAQRKRLLASQLHEALRYYLTPATRLMTSLWFTKSPDDGR
jgi:hypothetical protein